MDPTADNPRPAHEISRSNLPPPPPPPQSSGRQSPLDSSDLLIDEDGQGLPLDSSMINSAIRFSTSTYTKLPNVSSPSKSPGPLDSQSQAFQEPASVQEAHQSSQEETSQEVKPERLDFDSPSPQQSPSPPVHLVPESPVKSSSEIVDTFSFDPLSKPSQSASPTPEVDLKLETSKTATSQRLEFDSPSPQPSPSPPVHLVPESPIKSVSPLDTFDPLVQSTQATSSPSTVISKDQTTKKSDELEFLNYDDDYEEEKDEEETSLKPSASPQAQIVPEEPLVETKLDSFSKTSSHSVESTQLDDKEMGDVTSGSSVTVSKNSAQEKEQQPLGSAAVPPAFPGVTAASGGGGASLAADSFLSSQPASHFDQQPANPPQHLNKEESRSRLQASDTARTSASMSTESTSSTVSSSSCSCPFVLGE